MSNHYRTGMNRKEETAAAVLAAWKKFRAQMDEVMGFVERAELIPHDHAVPDPETVQHIGVMLRALQEQKKPSCSPECTTQELLKERCDPGLQAYVEEWVATALENAGLSLEMLTSQDCDYEEFALEVKETREVELWDDKSFYLPDPVVAALRGLRSARSSADSVWDDLDATLTDDLDIAVDGFFELTLEDDLQDTLSTDREFTLT